MNIIREYCEASNICVLRTDTYASSSAYISKLVNEAIQDYPLLRKIDVRIVVYGGDRRKGQMGIEFTPYGELPVSDDYVRIPELETAVN